LWKIENRKVSKERKIIARIRENKSFRGKPREELGRENLSIFL